MRYTPEAKAPYCEMHDSHGHPCPEKADYILRYRQHGCAALRVVCEGCMNVLRVGTPPRELQVRSLYSVGVR